MATEESWNLLKDEALRSTAQGEAQGLGLKKGRYFKTDVVWTNALIFLVSHLVAVPAFYLWAFFRISWQTWLFSLALGLGSSQGILLGAHRYYTHRSYKATLPLRVLIIFWNTIAIQNCLWEWARDHRQHHKHSDTDADPHNATRGFFFSHVGWLMMRKHPDVIAKGKDIDMSDLESDPLIMFQKRHYLLLVLLLSVAMPIGVPMYFWNESFAVSFLVPFLLRTIIVLNFTWMVNSWAHAFGNKPYDKSIRPVESLLVALVSLGEGWHNYHHCFPWDYRAAELSLGGFNPTTNVIHFFAWLGWAYDLKQASDTVVAARVQRTGDGSHPSVADTKTTTTTAKTSETESLDNTFPSTPLLRPGKHSCALWHSNVESTVICR
ncbi:acyl-CoA Delta(11) desaturase-like [Thrips palmi]|uniref:Acyl-CoA Delta(11) desaturase-like n=1 Tax=Thrips palmi TaxID=161013 RepID=A0A6P8Z8H8_THRPL|nr:acyl-CoA Delta(11) desaturase-like [Thrips palmi]